MSSGCATTASARVQSSGSGSSGGGLSMGGSMPSKRFAGQAGSRLGVGMAEISVLDPADDALLREFYDVEVAAFRVDHPHVVLRTYPQLVQMARRPSPFYRRYLLAAR